MVDSRAKNMFPTIMSGSKWFSLPYDFDTAIGINNEDAPVFSCNLEDIPSTSVKTGSYLRSKYDPALTALALANALSVIDTGRECEIHFANTP